MSAWRALVVKNRCRLSMRSSALTIENEEGTEFSIPFSQVGSITVETGECSLTGAVMQSMSLENIPLMFCDKRHMPLAELIPIAGTVERSGKIMDQSKWDNRNKILSWETIAKQKIRCQMQALGLMDLAVPKRMEELEQTLSGADYKGCEAQAARIYFSTIFGNGFSRDSFSPINDCLNYGYTILTSLVARIIRSHGYLTELGIHHCSRVNPYNFACDIMEPFRPIIDVLVATNTPRELTEDMKRLFWDLSNLTIHYKEKEMRLYDAIDNYFLDAVDSIESGEIAMGEVIL